MGSGLKGVRAQPEILLRFRRLAVVGSDRRPDE